MIFCEGLGEPEGPVALADGSWLVVEMAPGRGGVSRVSADGRDVELVTRTGRPNGLAVDGRGDIWVAESQQRAVLVLSPDGAVRREITADFLFPNDLAFGPDGMLYLTDSGLTTDRFFVDGAIRDDYAAAPYDGRLYRIDPRSCAVECLDAGIRFTNGLAFDAAGDLFVDETMTGMVFRYRLSQGSAVRENVGNVLDPALPTRYRGPDGMAVDVEGRLYCAVFGQGDITVLDRDGRVVDRIPTAGTRPTNVAFARDEARIVVTEVEHGRLETFAVPAPGLPLHAP
jgi:gluconolactonase